MMRVPVLSAAIGLILLAGCATEPLPPGAQPDETNISVTAFTIGTTISTIVVEVTGPDIASPLIFNLSVDEATDVASGTVRVPHGNARIFALTAFDDAGEITHEGRAEIDVRPGQNPPLRISLGPRSGHVPVTVSFGSYSVIVVPSSAALDLGGVSTAQLRVEVLDENGEVVSDLSNVQWATDAPAVATVDASGLVTGVMVGSATVVATYEGVAGMSAITVTGAGGGLPDADGDGWTADVDCDDTDSTVYPGAAEVLDGKDNDCNGVIDDVNGGSLIITEVMANPAAVSDAAGEWIEIYNGTAATVDLAGWILRNGTGSQCILPAATIAPNAYAVAGPSNDVAVNGGISGVVLCTGVPLINVDLTLTLLDPAESAIDGVSIPSSVSGISRSLDPDAHSAADNDTVLNWCPGTDQYGDGDLGTPGLSNPDCS